MRLKKTLLNLQLSVCIRVLLFKDMQKIYDKMYR